MNTSHLAPRANSGGALPARSSARRKALGLISRFPTGALGIQLRRLILIGSCLFPAAQGFASSSTVTLEWDATTEPDIAGYELRYGESSGNYTSTVQAGNTTTTSVSGLTDGKTYYFAVYAYNTAGLKSAPSNEAMHTVGMGIIPNDAIKVQYVSSEQPDANPAWHAIDGDPNTFWHSEWKTSAPPPPHELQLDLGSVQNLRGFRYLTRQDSMFNGTIAQYEFYVSSDGITWGNPVASGILQKTKAVQEVLFAATSGRYVRLRALSEVDGQPYTNVAELTLLEQTSSATNTAPSAIAQSVTTSEDTPVSFVLNGSDPEGSLLTYTVISNPTRGKISGTLPNLTYTPAEDFNGSDSLTFSVNDGSLNSALATISIKVTPINDAPIAIAKSYITPQATPFAIVLSGSDKESASLNYTVISEPANGSLSGVAPDLTYSPAAGFSGNDSFTFRVNDGAADSGNATISITVTPVDQVVANVPPTFANSVMQVSGTEDKAFRGQLSASDGNLGDTLTFAKVSGPDWLVVSPSGKLGGTPLNEDVGANSFTLSVTDSANATAAATLLINVANTNDAPIFTKTSFTYPSGAEQTPYTGQTLAGTATDPDKDDTLTYSKINGPNWLLISKTGELSGTPPLGSKGLNKFTIRATDQAGASSRASLQIQIEQNSLPLPWTADTIGVASMEAEAEYSAGNYTLAGAGTLTSTEDTGTFGYQTLTADGEIIAQVTELDDTGAAAHVGLTIRESLAPNSRLVSIGVNGAAVPKQLTRASTGGKTTKISAEASTPASYAAGPPPQSAAKSAKSRKIWLRLIRKGNTITSFTSSNGKKWKKVGSTNVKLRKNCYIGLSVSSGKNKRLNTATFSNVKVRS